MISHNLDNNIMATCNKTRLYLELTSSYNICAIIRPLYRVGANMAVTIWLDSFKISSVCSCRLFPFRFSNGDMGAPVRLKKSWKCWQVVHMNCQSIPPLAFQTQSEPCHWFSANCHLCITIKASAINQNTAWNSRTLSIKKQQIVIDGSNKMLKINAHD